jgi:hypothetical protein
MGVWVLMRNEERHGDAEKLPIERLSDLAKEQDLMPGIRFLQKRKRLYRGNKCTQNMFNVVHIFTYKSDS